MQDLRKNYWDREENSSKCIASKLCKIIGETVRSAFAQIYPPNPITGTTQTLHSIAFELCLIEEWKELGDGKKN